MEAIFDEYNKIVCNLIVFLLTHTLPQKVVIKSVVSFRINKRL